MRPLPRLRTPRRTLTRCAVGPIFGPACNIVGLCFTALTTVFFVFPPELPVTGNNMNCASPRSRKCADPLIAPAPPDAIVVFGIIAIVASLTWVFQGRKTFRGPRDLGGLLELARSELASPAKDVEGRVVGQKLSEERASSKEQ